MHWIEPYTFCYRLRNNTTVGDANEKLALDEVEKKLGGKIKSTRVIRDSDTFESGWKICEALVELP